MRFLLSLTCIVFVVGFANAAICRDFQSCAACTGYSKVANSSCTWCSSSSSCISSLSAKCEWQNRFLDSANCDLDRTLARAYEESFARNQMLALSAAAYSTNPQSCLTNAIRGGAQLRRQLTLNCDSISSDTCSGFTAVSPADRAIIIAFRGTTAFLQLVQEANEEIFAQKDPFVGGGNMGRYFNQAFQRLWSAGMRDDFLSLKSANPSFDLWVTGHSLGGAMASIAAGTIVATNLFSASKTKLVTYGQPRTGDHGYSAAIDSLLPYTYRITHATDIVPHLPSRDFEGYYHHQYEDTTKRELQVWYNNDMAPGRPYKQCGDDTNDCSGSNFLDLSINNHLHYFTHMISDFGHAGCTGSSIRALQQPQ